MTRKRLSMAMMVIAIAAGLIGSKLLAAPLVLYPISPSLPTGPYLRTFESIQVGAIVAFIMPEPARQYQRERGQELPADFLFMKPIAAGPGDQVCNSEADGLIINGAWRVPIRTHDQNGVALPLWAECRRLDHEEYFMLSDHVPNSFDSRYFGPVEKSDILAAYEPLY